MIIITKFQLDWLRDSLLDGTKDVLRDSIINQMAHLAREKSAVIELEINNYVGVVNQLKDLDRMMLGYGEYEQPIIIASAPVIEGNL